MMLGLTIFLALPATAIALARWAVARALGMRGIRFFFTGAIENPEAATPGRRALVVFAGLVASYLVASVLFATALLVGGRDEPSTLVRVLPDGPAAAAGMETGDRVLSLDGQPVARWEELARYLGSHQGVPVTVTVARGGAEPRFTVTPRGAPGRGKIGITAENEHRSVGVVEAVGTGLTEPVRVLARTGEALLSFVTGKAETQVAGPVEIVRETSKRSSGLGPVLYTIASMVAYVWPLAAIIAVATVPRRARRRAEPRSSPART